MRLIACLIAALVMMTGAAEAQLITRTFTTKTFNTTVNRTDTSAVLKLYEYPYIEVGTSTVGTDSLRLIVNVDYMIGATWIVGKRDTIKYGDATTANKVAGFTVRSPASTNIPGASQIRIRNTLIPFPSADSTSATSYSQYVIFRKEP